MNNVLELNNQASCCPLRVAVGNGLGRDPHPLAEVGTESLDGLAIANRLQMECVRAARKTERQGLSTCRMRRSVCSA